jgi:hypothetical protein
MTLRVAVLGDSAMWGQGLKDEHRYARLAAERIAAGLGQPLEMLPGGGDEPARGWTRSGAKIDAAVDHPRGSVEVLLPSGAVTTTPAGDRARFALTFRSLFASDAEMGAFLNGHDQRPAASLYGEHPATFPTLSGQLRLFTDGRPIRDVGLVILNGGINDVDYEEVLDPAGPDIAKIDRLIERVFRVRLADLLAMTRQAFPQAVIVVTGYFSPLSRASDRGELEELFKFFSGKPEWQLAINDTIQMVPVFSEVLNDLGLGKDIGELIGKAINRAVGAAAHAHFWARAAIDGLPARVLGPGIVFAFPAFRTEHALFTGERSLFHPGYKPPGSGLHSVADEMLKTRLKRIPRRGLLEDFRRILLLVGRATPPPESSLVDETEEQRDKRIAARQRMDVELRTLLASNPDLSGQIILTARDALEPPKSFPSPKAGETREKLLALRGALGSEIGRIEVATIASFVHPNREGAERVADRIVTAYDRHRTFSVKEAVQAMASGAGGISLRTTLPLHGIDPRGGLRQLVAVAFVDSIAVQFLDLKFPDLPDLVDEFYVGLVRAKLVLGSDVTFDIVIPAKSGNLLRAFDAPRDLVLADITEVTLEDAPEFRELVFFLNGHEHFRSRRDAATATGDFLRFPFGEG